MRVDEGFGGIVPALSAKQILDTIPDIDELAEVEVISQISSRLVVNQAAYKRRRADLQPLLDAFSRV